MNYREKLINLIIADALQIDGNNLENFAANLLIHGIEPLTEMKEEALEQEVYNRYSYQFDLHQSGAFADDNKLFKKWVNKQSVREYYCY